MGVYGWMGVYVRVENWSIEKEYSIEEGKGREVYSLN